MKRLHLATAFFLILLTCALVFPTVVHAEPSAAQQVHIVARGETLSQIARSYGVSVQAIMTANNLSSANRIYAGQRLIIPDGTSTSVVPATHTVQSGETLAAVSRQYGVSLSALAQVNNLPNLSLLYVGQTLTIPGSTNTNTTTPVPAPSAGTGGGADTHVVRQGETLYRISLQHNVSVNALLNANNLISPDRIYTGQRLSIPTGESAANAGYSLNPQAAVSQNAVATKEIVVNLTTQKVYAFENGQLVRQFVVSTGLPATPTVTGNFSIYLKYDSQRMSGPDYDLPGVPWVMYFYKGYGFHGTYWHSNFGQTMSHGCVNMRTSEASWLYQWAPIGTAVRVTY